MIRKPGSVSTTEEEGEINITPMLDVVFIMLIFFIVTASFVKEPGIQVDKPLAPTALSQKQANILVAITPGDEIWINNQRVAEDRVRPVIEQLRADNPKGTAVIQADKESSYKVAKIVMEAAKAAGVPSIAYSAEK